VKEKEFLRKLIAIQVGWADQRESLSNTMRKLGCVRKIDIAEIINKSKIGT
jgi:hypothetical protein